VYGTGSQIVTDVLFTTVIIGKHYNMTPLTFYGRNVICWRPSSYRAVHSITVKKKQV